MNKFKFDNVAERLRCSPAKGVCIARAGSNPVVVVFFFSFSPSHFQTFSVVQLLENETTLRIFVWEERVNV